MASHLPALRVGYAAIAYALFAGGLSNRHREAEARQRDSEAEMRRRLADLERQLQSERRVRGSGSRQGKRARSRSRSPSVERRPSNRMRRSPSLERSRAYVRRDEGYSGRGDSWLARPDSFRKGAGAKPQGVKICAVCLSRRPHDMRNCKATSTWDGRPTRSRRDAEGRLVDPEGNVLCVDWQRASGCLSRSEGHRHECAGCGSPAHGASDCPLAQEAKGGDAATA